MCAGHFAGNYLSYSLITWLPFYLVRERHFSMSETAVIAGSVYLAAAVSATTCGWASDRWIQAGGTPTTVRKTFLSVGCGLAGIWLLAGALVASQVLTFALLLLAVVSFAMSASNLFAASQTLAGPEAAGRWTGFQNFVGNLAGMVAPALTGLVLDRTGHFAWAFGVTTAIGVAGGLAFVFVVGPIEPVKWTASPTPVLAMPWRARRTSRTPVVRP